MVDPALSELARLLKRSDSDSVKLAAAKDILDRTGFKPTERQEIEQTLSHGLTPEVLAWLAEHVPRSDVAARASRSNTA